MTSRRNVSSPRYRPVSKSLREYGRGTVGGLLFSVPILYTYEVWARGFRAKPEHLLVYVAATFLLLLGYNRYAGVRRDASWLEVAIDSVEEMGIGLVVSSLVLYLLGRITGEMPPSEVIGKIVVEAMTVAVGVSVGTAQLGTNGNGESGEDRDTGMETEGDATKLKSESQSGPAPQSDQPHTVGQLVLSFCGAVLFAANVAPTEEIVIIAADMNVPRLLGLMLLSLVVGAVILFYSAFLGAERHVRRDSHFWILFGLASSYSAAILASGMMLWFFGQLDNATLMLATAQVVVLAFPAMLGAAAGRLLIQ